MKIFTNSKIIVWKETSKNASFPFQLWFSTHTSGFLKQNQAKEEQKTYDILIGH